MTHRSRTYEIYTPTAEVPSFLPDRETDAGMVEDMLFLQAAGLDTSQPHVIALLHDRVDTRKRRHLERLDADHEGLYRRPPKPEPEGLPCVYFIRNGAFVKIGCTTRDPWSRMRQMQLPPEAELAGVMPCDAPGTREAELHRMFAHNRDHGEWFRATPELDSLIAAWPVPAAP